MSRFWDMGFEQTDTLYFLGPRSYDFPRSPASRKLAATMIRRLSALSAVLLVTTPLGLAFAQTPAATTAPTLMKVGGDVLPPKLISSVEPKYPRPLFHKRKPSLVLVGLTVPADGIPTDIHIVKSGGDTFDKSALTAVQQYRFQPATLLGKPVSVAINVEVLFEIF
jgi:TonB family protein